jgi:cell division protein FtsA
MEEILDLVYYEIKASNLEKKLVGGIVLTGGGAMLKHIAQLAEYTTGLDARIGYPNEHLAKGMVEEVKSPVYATGVGLVLRGLMEDAESDNIDNGPTKIEKKPEKTKSAIFGKFKEWLKDESEMDDFN